MIGSYNCSIIGVWLQVSNYNFGDELEKNTAVYAPITFEDIVLRE